MEIPDENVFVEEDIGIDKVTDLYDRLTYNILARTRVLQPKTGICGGPLLFQGIEWEFFREYALRNDSDPDYAVVSIENLWW